MSLADSLHEIRFNNLFIYGLLRIQFKTLYRISDIVSTTRNFVPNIFCQSVRLFTSRMLRRNLNPFFRNGAKIVKKKYQMFFMCWRLTLPLLVYRTNNRKSLIKNSIELQS